MNLATLTPEQRAVVGRMYYRLREQAKKSTASFFPAVMKDERTHKSVILAPHQHVGLDFMDFHRRCVVIWPINHAKTTNGIAWCLRKILQNPNSRGAIVSATQEQAAKLISVIAGYIDSDPGFKNLALNEETGEITVRRGKTWTTTCLIVVREAGIKDPTVVAIGADSKGAAGARLDWILVDDLLNFENTRTKEQRDKIFTWLDMNVISRLEADGQICVMNSAWNPDDVLHRLEKLGWATLRMQVTGEIYIRDDVELTSQNKFWDSPYIEDDPGGDTSLGTRIRIKPALQRTYERRAREAYGLRKSPDKMLWNPHPTIRDLASLRRKHPIASEFNRLYMSSCRDDGSAMCKAEWIEQCKLHARERGYFRLPKRVSDPNMVFTGVDLAVSKNDGSDDTAFFTFEILPSGHRLIIDVIIKKMSSPEIKREIVRNFNAYGGVFRVENNAAQDFILQDMNEERVDIVCRPHTTGANKAREDYGVPSVFTEFANGAWLIPNDKHGVCEEHVQRFLDDCLYYVPGKHTGDGLMAAWFGREQAREFGCLGGSEWEPTNNPQTQGMNSIGANVMMR